MMEVMRNFQRWSVWTLFVNIGLQIIKMLQEQVFGTLESIPKTLNETQHVAY